MTRVTASFVAASAVVMALTIQGRAQDKPAAPPSNDPRTTLKAGYKDAAQMKKDTDLDPLREREDFKKLQAELE